MPDKLHWKTVTPLLKSTLNKLMAHKLFDKFILVGGTSLSLQLGHRFSVDIDLFTDATYDSIDFDTIDKYLRSTFKYVTQPISEIVGLGRSYFIGISSEDAVKLDIYYTDSFIRQPIIIDNIRMATIEDIIAMKIDIIQRGGRKKDFWDLYELVNDYSIEKMIKLHKERYPFNHNPRLIKKNLTDFTIADDDIDPNCLKGNYWELIKLYWIESLE